MTKVNIGGFIKTSLKDGPGVRSVLFFQGCYRACPSCHNPSLQPFVGGCEYNMEELLSYLNQKCINKKLTLSGGEPLAQQQALIELVCILADRDYDICLYTGAELGDIPTAILSHLHYVKTGWYNREQPVRDRFYGSSNQKLFEITKEEEKVCITEI